MNHLDEIRMLHQPSRTYLGTALQDVPPRRSFRGGLVMWLAFLLAAVALLGAALGGGG